MTRARDLAAFVSNADGDIKFDTDTLFIDSSANRVGIGTTTPDRSLHIAGNPGMIVLEDTGGSTDDKRAALFTDSGLFEIGSKNDDDSTRLNDMFVIDLGTGDIRMGDQGGTSTSRQKSFTISHQTGASSEYGGIKFLRAHQNSEKIGASIIHERPASSLDDSDLVFKTSTSNANATERMRILHSGGLTFNGDTAAANALDDYETGTWTPTVTQGGSGLTTAGTAVYIKIGKFVHTSFYVTGFSSTTTDSIKFGGLPFTTHNDAQTSGSVMWQNINIPTGRTQIVSYVPANNTEIRLYALGDNTTWHHVTGSNTGTSFNAIINIQYRIT